MLTNNIVRDLLYLDFAKAASIWSQFDARLDAIGFESYVAVQNQSVRSLRENIFEKIRDTEYFLFIDFPREGLVGNEDARMEFRGSLFAHQELAIASFLDIDILAFRDSTVRELDGMQGHLQINGISFTDYDALPQLVLERVSQRWASGWRNALSAVLDDNPPYRMQLGDSSSHGYFYLIRVDNAHRSTAARDCFAFIRSITNLRTGEQLSLPTAELKWAGVRTPSVSIMPGSYRELDALWIPEANPNEPQFTVLTDSTRHMPALYGPGLWEIQYEIVSSNVPGARCAVVLNLDGKTSANCVRAGHSLRTSAITRGQHS